MSMFLIFESIQQIQHAALVNFMLFLNILKTSKISKPATKSLEYTDAFKTLNNYVLFSYLLSFFSSSNNNFVFFFPGTGDK